MVNVIFKGRVLILAASAATTFFGLYYHNNLNKYGGAAKDPDCVAANNGQVEERIFLNGLISPSISVNLTAENYGKVNHLFVKEGSAVKKGQVVAMLETKDSDAQIIYKKLEIEALKQRSNLLERLASRRSLLAENSAISMADKEEAEARVFELRADMAKNESELATLLRGRESKIIVSPIDGIVAQIFAFPGTFVSPMTSASDSDQATKSSIMQIYSNLQVVINSPESMIFEILNSRSIAVSPSTDPRVSIPAKIERVMPYVVRTIDKVNAIPIRLDIYDTRPFLPGMGVDISITKPPVKGLGVKTHSIVRKNGKNGLLACSSTLAFVEVRVLGEDSGTSIVAQSPFIKPGFRYSTVGSIQDKSPGFLDFLGKDSFNKLKEGLNSNPLK